MNKWPAHREHNVKVPHVARPSVGAAALPPSGLDLRLRTPCCTVFHRPRSCAGSSSSSSSAALSACAAAMVLAQLPARKDVLRGLDACHPKNRSSRSIVDHDTRSSITNHPARQPASHDQPQAVSGALATPLVSNLKPRAPTSELRTGILWPRSSMFKPFSVSPDRSPGRAMAF